jgi:dUTP pyrophosphatase
VFSFKASISFLLSSVNEEDSIIVSLSNPIRSRILILLVFLVLFIKKKSLIFIIERVPLQNNFNIKIKILNEFAKLPSKSHEDDIGYDLYADGEYVIKPNKVILVQLGISIQLPENVGGFVLPRSGLASKYLIAPINSPGLIDPGYTGQLMIPLMNYSDKTYTVTKHERVAQLVVISTGTITFDEVSDLDESDRSSGGFGSTGKN